MTAGVAAAASRLSRGWVLALTSAAAFLVALDALIVTPALVTIGRDLHAALPALQWSLTAYAITFAAAIIPAAAAGDRFGRRRVLVAGLALFTAASAGCAAAPDWGWLLAARAVQGVGAAAVQPLSLAIVTAAFPAARRGLVLGLWAGIGGVAVAAGPVLGGMLAGGPGWRWIFWANLPIGLACLTAARLRLPESRRAGPAPDVRTALLLAGVVLALVWGCTAVAQSGWDPLSAAAGAGAVALVIALVRRRPSGWSGGRGFVTANATAALSAAAINGGALLSVLFFEGAQGRSPMQAGLALLPWTLGPLLLSPLGGALADRVGTRPVLVGGMLLEAAGLGWLAACAGLDADYGGVVVPLALVGAGLGLVLPTASSAAISTVRADALGIGAGVVATVQRLGGALGVALASSVFTACARGSGAASVVSGARPSLAVAAALALAGAAAAGRLDARTRRAGGRTPFPTRSPAAYAAES